MDLQEIYKEESGYDVGRYKIDNTNYYSGDYVEWLEKKLRMDNVVGRVERSELFPSTCPSCGSYEWSYHLGVDKMKCLDCGKCL